MNIHKPKVVSTRSRCNAAVLLLAIVVILVIVTVENPHEAGNLPACPFRVLTGWLCPGCGSTRMMHHVMHGEFVLGAKYNPVAFAFVPVLFGAMLHLLFVTVMGRRLHSLSIQGWMFRVMLVLLLGWGFIRNFFDSPATL